MMTTQEAITLLKGANVDCHPSSRNGEALRILLREYETLFKTVEAMGPRLLAEMQLAADWEAIAIRQKRMLTDRHKPGMDAVIKEFLHKLEEQTVEGTHKP